jgi:predicted metal-binding protein
MTEYGDVARRKAFANMYEKPKDDKKHAKVAIFVCSSCGNVLKSKKEVDEKICSNCKK